MKIIKKAKNLAYRSKGAFTKEDGWIDYTELHAFGIGLFDGFKFTNYYKSLEKARKQFEDVDAEPHYHRQGYFIGNRIKYLVGFAIVYYYGVPQSLVMP